jgi:hypothetical protein
MISFALAQELRNAGLTQSLAATAKYFLNEHLMIIREDALRMWHADHAKRNWELKIEEELVYCPTLSELIEGCGLPFALSAEATGHWCAKNNLLGEATVGEGSSPAEAVARLWLICHKNI